MTIKGIQASLGTSTQNIGSILKNNYGFYISEWLPSRGMPISVWKCVDVPFSEPRPIKAIKATHGINKATGKHHE